VTFRVVQRRNSYATKRAPPPAVEACACVLVSARLDQSLNIAAEVGPLDVRVSVDIFLSKPRWGKIAAPAGCWKSALKLRARTIGSKATSFSLGLRKMRWT